MSSPTRRSIALFGLIRSLINSKCYGRLYCASKVSLLFFFNGVSLESIAKKVENFILPKKSIDNINTSNVCKYPGGFELLVE